MLPHPLFLLPCFSSSEEILLLNLPFFKRYNTYLHVFFFFSNDRPYRFYKVGQKPSNDRCIDSVLLVEGEMTNGDNSNANFDYNNQGVCGSRSDRRAVWYEINGIGKEVTVNICTNNDKITDYGIFRACNTQNCLGAPAQQLEAANCGVNDQESNPYSFLAIDGESYYVHVRSDVVFEGEGSNVSQVSFGSILCVC